MDIMDEKIKNFIAKLNSSISELWAKDKIFLVVFGILILIVKFRDVIIDILLKSAKTEMDQAGKKDEKLAQQENQAKEDAAALVQKSKEEPLQNKPVTEDWNKKP